MKGDIEILEEEQSTLVLTRKYLLDYIRKSGLVSAVQKFNIPESFISENLAEFNKSDFHMLLAYGGYVISEDFLNRLLKMEYLYEDDIRNLSMSIYANLSQEFLQKYNDYINWDKMLSYLLNSDKVDNLNAFKEVIEKYKMWSLVSASPMSIEFIRENKDKLDWEFVTIMTDFTEEELEEFSEYIKSPKSFTYKDNYIDIDTAREELSKVSYGGTTYEIEDVKVKQEFTVPADISSKMDGFSPDQLSKINDFIEKMGRDKQ